MNLVYHCIQSDHLSYLQCHYESCLCNELYAFFKIKLCYTVILPIGKNWNILVQLYLFHHLRWCEFQWRWGRGTVDSTEKV